MRPEPGPKRWWRRVAGCGRTMPPVPLRRKERNQYRIAPLETREPEKYGRDHRYAASCRNIGMHFDSHVAAIRSLKRGIANVPNPQCCGADKNNLVTKGSGGRGAASHI